MDSNSSEEEDDSDVFYSCDSEYLATSNSPIKTSIINDSSPVEGKLLLFLLFSQTLPRRLYHTV